MINVHWLLLIFSFAVIGYLCYQRGRHAESQHWLRILQPRQEDMTQTYKIFSQLLGGEEATPCPTKK